MLANAQLEVLQEQVEKSLAEIPVGGLQKASVVDALLRRRHQFFGNGGPYAATFLRCNHTPRVAQPMFLCAATCTLSSMRAQRFKVRLESKS